MSFILDALKKSETDRQEKSTPDISDVPTARPQAKTSIGAWYLVGFLSLIVVILLAVLLRPAKGPPPMVAQELALPDRNPGPAAPAPQTTETASQSVTAEDMTPDLAQETGATEPAPQPAEESLPVAAAFEPAAVTQAPPVEPPPTQSTVTQESFLTFNDLRASGGLDLPDLHIDLHVFSETPSDRFVFINMNQYRENAVLSEGPRLREITTEGVILEYVGTTFLLPRE